MADEKVINRDARETNSRESTMRKKTWTPPQTMPDPKPQPGWVFRWIRTSLMGDSDPTNVSSKLREGWEPCKAEDHPEMMLSADAASRFKGNIEVGGLMLCKAPEEFVAQRKEYYERNTATQMQAVDSNFMRENDERMPVFNERKSTSTFGKGNK